MQNSVALLKETPNLVHLKGLQEAYFLTEKWQGDLRMLIEIARRAEVPYHTGKELPN